ncbi:hypothetical protein KOR42_45030 [Thalassoglobus neptunius]|uniref:Uncharacterized protein n=1 Tax=Thalassoglobus neptunius TaxID=1938619 RepID=A0A5C5VY78_9PLAN|nr:hypothetical protein [Thalassoglobus neptunius]TWT43097.1 hypothetical protein KOR42_45030 [Thalassoglobus neptunius]
MKIHNEEEIFHHGRMKKMSQSWKALAVPAFLITSVMTGCATQQCGPSGCVPGYCDSTTYAPVHQQQVNTTYSPSDAKTVFEPEQAPSNASGGVPAPPMEPTF